MSAGEIATLIVSLIANAIVVIALRAQVSNWRNDNERKDQEAKERAEAAAQDAKTQAARWQAEFEAAKTQRAELADRWKNEFETARTEAEKLEQRWIKEFEHSRELAKQQSSHVEKQLRHQWLHLRDQPLLAFRAERIRRAYDAITQLVTTVKMHRIWLKTEEGGHKLEGRPTAATVLLNAMFEFVAALLGVGPYVPEKIRADFLASYNVLNERAQAVSHQLADGRTSDIDEREMEHILVSVRILASLLNPPGPNQKGAADTDADRKTDDYLDHSTTSKA